MTAELDTLVRAATGLTGVLYLIAWMYVLGTLANWAGVLVAMYRMGQIQKRLIEEGKNGKSST